jgi:hypothetical protein
VVCEERSLSEKKESTGNSEKGTFAIKLHTPKNPFKSNPFKRDKE